VLSCPCQARGSPGGGLQGGCGGWESGTYCQWDEVWRQVRLSVTSARRSGHAKRVAAHLGPAAPRSPRDRALSPVLGQGPCASRPRSSQEQRGAAGRGAGWGSSPQPWHPPPAATGLGSLPLAGHANKRTCPCRTWWPRVGIQPSWRRGSPSLRHETVTHHGRDTASACPPNPGHHPRGWGRALTSNSCSSVLHHGAELLWEGGGM